MLQVSSPERKSILMEAADAVSDSFRFLMGQDVSPELKSAAAAEVSASEEAQHAEGTEASDVAASHKFDRKSLAAEAVTTAPRHSTTTAEARMLINVAIPLLNLRDFSCLCLLVLLFLVVLVVPALWASFASHFMF